MREALAAIRGQIILCLGRQGWGADGEGRPGHYRMLSSISGLHQLDDSSTLPPL